jgi:hypothetical protein
MCKLHFIDKKEDSTPKITRAKWTGGMGQAPALKPQSLQPQPVLEDRITYLSDIQKYMKSDAK